MALQHIVLERSRPSMLKAMMFGAVSMMVAFAAKPAIAQQPQLITLPGGPGLHGISADGNVVVGGTHSPNTQAYRWTSSTGLATLGLLPGGTFSYAYAVNSDGSVIVGEADSSAPLLVEAFIWTAANGMVGLGALPGATRSNANAVSLDGSVVVGRCRFPGGNWEPFRWTAATGMVALGGFPGEPLDGQARATNADGSVIVGQSKVGTVDHAFRWTAQSGMVSLGVLPGYTGSSASDVSADGNVVVGGVFTSNATEAFKWTPSSGMVGLGDLPGGLVLSVAYGVSDSGLVIVGKGRAYLFSDVGVFWTPLEGPIPIAAQVAYDVSADGLRVVGSCGGGCGPYDWLAIFPNSWKAYCTAKVNSLGCTPTISASGVPSASNAWSFEVVTSQVLNQKVGLYLYRVGGSSAAVPFQGGTLCVGPAGIRRTPGVFSGGNPAPANDCSGRFALDFNAFAAGLVGGNPDPALLTTGYTYRCQVWGRDPGFAPPNNASLSNALQVPIGP